MVNKNTETIQNENTIYSILSKEIFGYNIQDINNKDAFVDTIKSQTNLLNGCNAEDSYTFLLNSFINDCSKLNKITVKELKYKWNPNFKISKLTYSKYNKISNNILDTK